MAERQGRALAAATTNSHALGAGPDAGRADAGRAGAAEAVIKVQSRDGSQDSRDSRRKAEERDAQEIHQLLCTALARLQQHPFVPADLTGPQVSALVSTNGHRQSAAAATSKYAVSPADAEAAADAAANTGTAPTCTPPDLSITNLIYQVRDAHRASVYRNDLCPSCW